MQAVALSLTQFPTIDAANKGRDGSPRQARGDIIIDPA